MGESIAEVAAGLTRDMITAPGLRGTVEDRFWKKVAKYDDCWEWHGKVSSRGYGVMHTPYSSSTPAHKVSFILHGGSIAPGNLVDHICRNRKCVNPAHLREATIRQNTTENSESVAAKNIVKTHRDSGHELSGDNLRVDRRGWRACRKCQVIHVRNSRRRKRDHLISQGADHDR